MSNCIKWGGIICRYLFLLLLLNSCTSPGNNAIDPAEHEQASAVSAGMVRREVHTIDIREMKFQPDEITVHKGDTVIWRNNDLVTHCITEETSKLWTSSNIPAGASWRRVINESADYFCAIHQVMKGKLVVQ